MKAFLASLWVAVACGTHTTELVDDGGSLPGLVSLEISPGQSAVSVRDLGAELAVELAATGEFRDGTTRDVTDQITWNTDRDDAGEFVMPGRWSATNRGGGIVTVEARSGGVSANAQIVIDVNLSLDDPTFPPPPGTSDHFSSEIPVMSGDEARCPRIVYPAHEVMLPLQLERILFQYDAGTVADVFRLSFRSAHLNLRVLTSSDRWRPDEQVWRLMTTATAGDRMTMVVEGIAATNPVVIWASRPTDIAVATGPANGALYYWASGSQGVMRADPSQAAPTRFHAQPPDTSCVGCHSVSRDGTRFASGYDGEKLQEVSVPDRAPIIQRSRDMGWSSFSADGRRLLIAHRGELVLLDANSGEPVGPNGGIVDAGGPATHPDFSPLGDQVVVARCGRADDNRSVERCSIVRIPFGDDIWGTPEVLVAAGGGDDNNYFPRYSPDGAWIAYTRAGGKSRDQPSAELRMIPAGGGAPFTLNRINHRVGPLDGVSSIANTMPAWAPSGDDGIYWLAFASARDYGKIATGANPPQIWIAGVDLARTGDPSFSAFWLPAQDPTQRNHRPYWSMDPEDPQ